MRGDYGVDDFLWLLDRGGGHAIDVAAPDSTFEIPAAVFDNRIDHTSFLRADHSEWDSELVYQLHAALTTNVTELTPL